MRYTPELLDALRLEGDPVPDTIIAELACKDSIDAVNNILRQIIHNEQPIPEELPDNIEFWLRDEVHLPAWTDRERLDRGSELFVEHGATMALILSTASLVECYAAAKGCKVLAYTYRLGQNAYRRIAETAQFLLDVMAPGSLYEEDKKLRTIQKVRLMHSSIRYLILQTGRWPGEEFGYPICQEDMVGTLMAFSYIVIRDLRRIGACVSEEEAEDYLYMWRVIGEMMGVRPDVIPTNMAEAEEFWEWVQVRHHEPSPQGVLMTKALLEFHADNIPGKIFDNIIPAFIRWLVGDEIADWMEVPRNRWDRIIHHKQKLGRALDLLDRGSGPVADVIDRLALAYLDRKFFHLNHYERTGFEIPTELDDAWHNRPPGERVTYSQKGVTTV